MTTTTHRAAGMSVSALAARVGVRPHTVRYYERAGLLPAPARTSAEHRRYDEGAVDRLQFIQGAQRLGLRLREIRDLLAVRDTGSCPCGPAADLLQQRLTEIDAEMARLSALRAEVAAMAVKLPTGDCPEPEPGRWCPTGGEVRQMADVLCEAENCTAECCESGCC